MDDGVKGDSGDLLADLGFTDADLLALGLTGTCSVCGGPIVQRRGAGEGVRRARIVAASGARARRAPRPPLALADDVVSLEELWFARSLDSGLGQ